MLSVVPGMNVLQASSVHRDFLFFLRSSRLLSLSLSPPLFDGRLLRSTSRS